MPGVLRWPAGLGGGRTVGEMIHFCDWFPTLLAMAGVDPPEGGLALDGVDALPVIRGERGAEGAVTRRFWQWNRYTPLVTCNAAMRDGDWKLVRPRIAEAMAAPDGHHVRTCMYDYEHFAERGVITDPEPDRDVPPPPPPELYNLAEDPCESANLAAKHPERVSRMLGELETWFAEVEAERAAIDDEW